MDRIQMAADLERNRKMIVRGLQHHPLEIEWGRGTNNYWRVVINTEEDLDKHIAELKSEVVTSS